MPWLLLQGIETSPPNQDLNSRIFGIPILIRFDFSQDNRAKKVAAHFHM